MKTLDHNTVASHPGGFRLSQAKLTILQPDLYGPLAWLRWDRHDQKLVSRRSFWLTRIEEQLRFGDSRAAVVIATSPLLIAAYTDEIDCVALLRFHDRFISEYDLKPGSRLITVNVYEFSDGVLASDLIQGPGASHVYKNFTPFIADFLTNDRERLARRKAQISEDEWQRTEELGQSYVAGNYARPRDGRPCWSDLTAKQLPKHLTVLEPSKPAPVTILEVPKRILFVVIFLPLTLWGVIQIQINQRLGLFLTALFGTMLVLSIIALVQLPRDLKRSVNIRDAYTAKSALMPVVLFAISFVLGFAGELIFGALNTFWPNFAIAFSTFLTNLAFYPFRGAEMKRDYPTVTYWIVLCTVLGLISVALAHFFDWVGIANG